MTDNPISKQKLLAYLKSMRVDVSNIDNDNRLMYSIGRNGAIDLLLICAYCGDFDEVPCTDPNILDQLAQSKTAKSRDFEEVAKEMKV